MGDLLNITFKEFITKAEVLRTQYQEFLVPFFCASKIRLWKTLIYSLDMEEWRKDKIWEYLNGDEELEILENLA